MYPSARNPGTQARVTAACSAASSAENLDRVGRSIAHASSSHQARLPGPNGASCESLGVYYWRAPFSFEGNPGRYRKWLILRNEPLPDSTDAHA